MDIADQATEMLERQESLVQEHTGSIEEHRKMEIEAFTNCVSTIDTLSQLQSLEDDEKQTLEEVLAGAIARARSNAPMARTPGFGGIHIAARDTITSNILADENEYEQEEAED